MASTILIALAFAAFGYVAVTTWRSPLGKVAAGLACLTATLLLPLIH